MKHDRELREHSSSSWGLPLHYNWYVHNCVHDPHLVDNRSCPFGSLAPVAASKRARPPPSQDTKSPQPLSSPVLSGWLVLALQNCTSTVKPWSRQKRRTYTQRRSNWRPSACETDVLATRSWVQRENNRDRDAGKISEKTVRL